MWKARERGVIFDVGHGAGSFWFRNAVPAIQQGFIPDSISTDLHTGNVYGVGDRHADDDEQDLTTWACRWPR